MKDYIPRPYGLIGTSFIIDNPRCGLWAGMGMGKGVMTLTALDAIRYVTESTRPALVLGPLRVARSVWPNEAAKWSHLEDFRVRPMTGDPKERADALDEAIRGNLGAVSMNYDNVPWLLEQCGDDWPFETIVADESTRLKNARPSEQVSTLGNTFIRSAGGKRAGLLAKVAFLSERFIELTGTPAPNGIEDLWGQAWFLDKGSRLGRTHTAYIQRWFRPKQNGYGSEPLAHAQADIQNQLRDIVLTLDPKDWFDLREPIVNIIKVELPPKARKHYREMERELFTVLEGREVEASNAASKTIKCLQICNGAMYVEPPEGYQDAVSGNREWLPLHDAKLEALESVIEEAAGMPVLVGYHFKPDLARLVKRFPQGVALKTKKHEDDFAAGKIPILFAHPQSAGHGIDGWQEATNIVCFYGNWWDAEMRNQFIGRIDAVRQFQAGKDRAVFVHYIVAARTIEEDLVERVDDKISTEQILKEAMKRERV